MKIIQESDSVWAKKFKDTPTMIYYYRQFWNSCTGVIIDAVRCAKIDLNTGLKGPIDSVQVS